METSYAGHARIGRPSDAEYWVYCAGSIPLCANVNKPDNDSQLEGEDAHELGAKFLLNRYTVRCFLPHMEEVLLKNGYLPTDEMRKYVSIYINDIIKIIGDQTISLDSDNIERVIPIHRIHPESFGTCDCWFHDPINNILYVWDFKYGYAPVEAYENWQLIMYSVGLLDFITNGNGLTSGITISMRVCQPRAPHIDGPIREWRIKAAELRPYIDRLVRQAHAACDPEPLLVTGEHCKNCDGLIICPAATRSALNAVDVSMKYTDIELLNIGRHWQLLKRAKETICNQFDALETFALQSIKNGVIIPELDIQPCKGNTSWRNDNNIVFAMGDLMGIDLRQLKKPCTPLQAINKGIPKEIVKIFSKHTSGKLKLVKHDSRKAMEIMKNE